MATTDPNTPLTDDEIRDAFDRLGLRTELDRQRYRALADLGHDPSETSEKVTFWTAKDTVSEPD